MNNFPYMRQGILKVFYISHISNLPVVCMNPTTNEFRVQLLDVDNDLLESFVDYNLILYFKKL